jgi:hypothetical protein
VDLIFQTQFAPLETGKFQLVATAQVEQGLDLLVQPPVFLLQLVEFGATDVVVHHCCSVIIEASPRPKRREAQAMGCA